MRALRVLVALVALRSLRRSPAPFYRARHLRPEPIARAREPLPREPIALRANHFPVTGSRELSFKDVTISQPTLDPFDVNDHEKEERSFALNRGPHALREPEPHRRKRSRETMGRQAKWFAAAAWGSFILVGLSCGTVDPADSRGQAGSAGTGPSAGDGNVSGTGGSGDAGGDGHGDAGGNGHGDGGTANPGGAPPTDGGKPPLGDGGSGGVPDPGVVEPLLPWRVGNSWTYRITKNGVVTEKTTVVGEEEAVGGNGPNAELLANHVMTDKGAKDHTESWQAPSAAEPERIVRYREQAFSASTGKLSSEVYYSPEKLHVDGTPAHTLAGASWTEKYSETELVVGMPAATHATTETWTVVADDETLKVPAGTFEGVIHLQKKGSSTKDYWYARGVGKLKETGTQTEELTAYSLEP